MRLKDKVTVVTGAGSGFGAGIARRFATEGARVCVNDIDAAAGAAVVEAIRANGGIAQFVHADVTRDAEVAALISAPLAKWGRVDVVVNNAGWTHRRKPLLEVSDDEFERVFSTNVKSIFLTARHAVPVFRRQKGGVFVNIASTAGVRPRPGLTVYNSSKGAVITLSKSMAAELGPDKIRVNCVNPVFNPDTNLGPEFAGGAITEEVREAFLATIPLGRFSTSEDVANAALYLASDEAAFVSGVCIEVDGARCV